MRTGRAFSGFVALGLAAGRVGAEGAGELLGGATGAPASAEAAAAGSGLGLAVAPNLGGMMLQLSGAVLVVVLLILVLHRLARRFGSGFTGAGRDGAIEIVSQRSVGNRTSLAVVRVLGQTMLVGISPQGVQPVAQLTGSDGLAGADGVAGGSGAASRPIADRMPSRAPDPVRSPARGAGRLLRLLGRVFGEAPGAEGEARRTQGSLSIAAAAVDRRPGHARREALADLEEAARIARASEQRDAQAPPVDLQRFEDEFRSKLREIQGRYPSLGELEGEAR